MKHVTSQRLKKSQDDESGMTMVYRNKKQIFSIFLLNLLALPFNDLIDAESTSSQIEIQFSASSEQTTRSEAAVDFDEESEEHGK